MFVTNALGAGPTASVCVTGSTNYGLRTLSGGQYSLSVEGFLAIEDGATPDIVIEEPHSIRDVAAVVRHEPAGAPIEIRLRQSGELLCGLTIPAHATLAEPVDGWGLPLLQSGALLTADITSVGTESPGADLTITIRL
jgi:hypothetical protein